MSKESRFANRDWGLPTADDGRTIATWDAVKIAVLMDIRDELQKLNRSQMLQCDVAWAIKNMAIQIRGLRRDLKRKKRKR